MKLRLLAIGCHIFAISHGVAAELIELMTIPREPELIFSAKKREMRITSLSASNAFFAISEELKPTHNKDANISNVRRREESNYVRLLV